MITVKDLPENIAPVIESYITKGEKFDVFPSKFFIDNTYYYLFTISPVREGLLIKDDGSVPLYKDIKKAALIALAYNTSIETIMGTGLRWVKSNTRRNYGKLLTQLTKVKRILKSDLPEDVNPDLEAFINTPKKIIANQEIIETCVKNAVDLVDKTNQKEITTIEDQQLIRKYVVEMTRAGYRQNMIQLETEGERERVITYLSSKLFSKPRLIFHLHRIKKINQKMLISSSKTTEDILEAGIDLEAHLTESLEETEKRKQVLQTFRNPR